MNTKTLPQELRALSAEMRSVANACEADGGSPFLITYARKWQREIDDRLSALAQGEEPFVHSINCPQFNRPCTCKAALKGSEHE